MARAVDLDLDGARELVLTVVCTTSEDNGHATRALVLSSHEDANPALIAVSGVYTKHDRDISSISIDGSEIVGGMSVYLPNDPGCCPTGEAEVRWRIEGRQLVEVGAR